MTGLVSGMTGALLLPLAVGIAEALHPVGPREPAFPAKPYYAQDFAGIANTTTLRSLPGWAAYNSASSTNAKRDQWLVQNNAITRAATSQDYDTAPGLFVIGRDSGSTNHTIRCKLAALPSNGNALMIVVAATDQQNCVVMQCVNSGGVMQSFSLRKNVAGTLTTLPIVTGPTGGLGRSLQVGDEIELQAIGQYVHLFVNGRRITADTGSSLDTGGAFTKGSVCGFGTAQGTGVVFDDVYVAPLVGVVTMDATPIFWPGSLVQGGRNVPLSGTYSGDVQALDYRVLNDATNAVVKDWARVSGAAISSGAWSGSMFVPMGSLAVNPKVRVQVRAANDVDARALSTPTTVGLTVGSYGQSNSSYRGQGTATAHAVANAYSWSQDDNSKWLGGAATTTTRSQLWATKIAERCGIPVGVFVYGAGSQTIVSLTADGAGYFDNLEAAATSANAYGFIQSWLWTQGEAEASAAQAFNETAYRATFDTLLGKLRGAIAGRADAPVGICVIGHTSGGHISGATFGDANWSATRAGLTRLLDKPGVFMATHLTDATLTDSLHYVANAYVENGRRAGMSMAAALGYGGANGRGSLVIGVARSGVTITLTVDLNGASSISGTGLTNYQVSANDFATTLAISSVAVSGGNIVITLAADPGVPIKVRSFYGMTWTSPVRAVGYYADGTSIPVEPIYTPLAQAT